MTRRTHHFTVSVLALAALALSATSPAQAQRAGEIFGGDLPQEYANDISSKFDQMRVEQMKNDPAFLEQFYSRGQLDTFFANTVAKLTVYPDGSYLAYARPGGELVEIELGRKRFAPAADALASEPWLLKAGELATPKRPQPIALRLAAGGNEMSVECLNRLERTDKTITYYVGPLNGLVCLGLVDDEAPPFDEVLRTADSRIGAVAAPGS